MDGTVRVDRMKAREDGVKPWMPRHRCRPSALLGGRISEACLMARDADVERFERFSDS